MQRLKLLLIVTLATVFLLGCTQMSAEEIAKKMQEKYDSIKDYKGIQRTVIEMNGKTQIIEYEFVFKKPNKFWMLDKRNDILIVFNGNKMWTYDKKNNTVIVMNVNTPPSQSPDYGKLVRDILERFNVELVGTEKISGKDCYILELKPKSKDIVYESIRMWVDKEYWFPIKTQLSMKGMSIITEYTNIEFNTGISDKLFEFKPPKDAKVIVKEFEFKVFKDIEEAQKHVQFKILTPKYTAGCELKSISVINKSVLLNYMNNSAGKYMIVKEELSKDINLNLPGAKVENIRIGNTEGKYMELASIKTIVFKKEDVLIRISGNIDKDELIKVAESIS